MSGNVTKLLVVMTASFSVIMIILFWCEKFDRTELRIGFQTLRLERHTAVSLHYRIDRWHFSLFNSICYVFGNRYNEGWMYFNSWMIVPSMTWFLHVSLCTLTHYPWKKNNHFVWWISSPTWIIHCTWACVRLDFDLWTLNLIDKREEIGNKGRKLKVWSTTIIRHFLWLFICKHVRISTTSPLKSVLSHTFPLFYGVLGGKRGTF